ncbi:TPA: CatB-related O-acetyltransferase [Vibrio vulnificus]
MKEVIKNYYIGLKYKCKVDLTARVSLNLKVGEGTVVEKQCLISNSHIGVYSYIGNESRIFGTDIGNFSSIGPRVIIGENEHLMNKITTSNYLHSEFARKEYTTTNSRRTSIGSDVWIGAGAFIKKGINIGHGSVVGAYSVVTKDVPPYAIVCGIPANIIKFRFTEHVIEKLLTINWWDKDIKLILENKAAFDEANFDNLIRLKDL